MEQFGSYLCPTNAEGSPPLSNYNATVDRRDLHSFPARRSSDLPTPPLAWQRYPHADGFVQPWTSSGTLRAGLRFKGHGRGGCVVVDETAISAISCLTPNGRRYDACFPQWRDGPPGELAACGGLGGTRFVRWTITGQSADA